MAAAISIGYDNGSGLSSSNETSHNAHTTYNTKDAKLMENVTTPLCPKKQIKLGSLVSSSLYPGRLGYQSPLLFNR
eukprot:scaffold64143_cov68-Attheya_sp.AAC.1